jgi:hypothetical protein
MSITTMVGNKRKIDDIDLNNANKDTQNTEDNSLNKFKDIDTNKKRIIF